MGESAEFEKLRLAYQDAVIDAMEKGDLLFAAVGKEPAAVLKAQEAADRACKLRDELERKLLRLQRG